MWTVVIQDAEQRVIEVITGFTSKEDADAYVEEASRDFDDDVTPEEIAALMAADFISACTVIKATERK